MPHETPLISMIVVALVLAFILGAIANRFRFSPLVGYLLAGVLIGPFTPGFVADQNLANDLAEIGVILLMFGVGLNFTLEDLLSVRTIAVPGAVAQIASATLLGMGLAYLLGWSIGAGLVFGLALSVASTVVLLRALQDRRLIETERGRIAVGWLVVEDFVMILALVLLPALAGIMKGAGGTGFGAVAMSVLVTLGKVAAFVVVMLVIGKRVIPWVLHAVAHTGSRELFRLCVLAIALGVAYGASVLFGVSFALGAFFAGMILSESELSQRAASETLPLRDAFAVLFFVSVGMLVDPMILVREPLPLLATVLIIVLGKSIAAFLIVRLFGYPTSHALTVSASLAQIGEFSFILAGLGVSLALLPDRARDLILAGAIISILLNPVLFVCLDWHLAKVKPTAEPASAPPADGAPAEAASREPIPATSATNHVVLVGYGRVGRIVARDLLEQQVPLVLIEEIRPTAQQAREAGLEVMHGNATDPDILQAANIPGARCLLVAIPDAFEGCQAVAQARALNPVLPIIARSHSDEESEHLMNHGATKVIMGEHEIAIAMLADVPRSLGYA
ncbi:MAG: Kef family K(+) transporter [Hyphomonadaceae bacterium]|jgi:CPA2 family monovalent cation:H+ antiporter-2|nr:Kef family K(+) transporter [Hyphomonadaceae bacterium]